MAPETEGFVPRNLFTTGGGEQLGSNVARRLFTAAALLASRRFHSRFAPARHAVPP